MWELLFSYRISATSCKKGFEGRVIKRLAKNQVIRWIQISMTKTDSSGRKPIAHTKKDSLSDNFLRIGLKFSKEKSALKESELRFPYESWVACAGRISAGFFRNPLKVSNTNNSFPANGMNVRVLEEKFCPPTRSLNGILFSKNSTKKDRVGRKSANSLLCQRDDIQTLQWSTMNVGDVGT